MRSILLSCLICLLLAHPVGAEEITPEHWAEAVHFSRSHGGVALRVQQGGKVVYQDYARGYSDSTPHRIYSGTKSFVAVAALIAMEDGLLTLKEKASDTLTEWKHDRRRDITIEQLLSQTSGLDPGADVIYPARDQFAAAVRVHLISAPGTRFHYGPVGYQAFGEILRRKLQPKGRSVEGYIRERLIDPLGIDIDTWKHDDAGNPLLHTGLYLTAPQWAKFGEFVKSLCQSPQKQLILPQDLKLLLTGHRANPAYGIGFWLNAPLPVPRHQPVADLQVAIDGDQIYPGGPRDLYTAIGSEKQRLYIIPSLDLVIVRFGNEARFSDGDFLSRLLTGHPHPDAHTH
jgi:CubicO group peptidase (beta-lactamase class C family)